MEEYKITILKTLLLRSFEIIVLVLSIYGFYILFIRNPLPGGVSIQTLSPVVIYILMLLWWVGYPFFITYNHYKYDRHTLLRIDYENEKVFYKTKDIEKEFLISDITYIKHFEARKFTIHYYKIYLKDGTNIDITSLVMPILDEDMDEIKMGNETTYNLLLHRDSISDK